MKKRARYGLMFACALMIPATATHADPEEMIKYRKNVMKAIGGHSGALFAIARDRAGDASHLEAHVRSLAATSMLVKDVFQSESELGDTRAAPEIWSDPEGFAKAVATLEDAASGVLTAYESNGDLGAALNALGKSCKGCHDDYRTDD
ncbi:MAG: cytochrome c [Proteobacteria bacterium]|nr:MAG: cytochrome c [Pseudomonadota bacterium]